MSLSSEDAQSLRDCVADGGVAIFPTDTVYGICCDPDDEQAAARLYELKRRPAARASAVMFFALADALTEIEQDLHDSEVQALRRLLPGPVTLLLANRAGRFGPACTVDPQTLGLRVPSLGGGLSALGAVGRPVLQSSANLSGGPDARTLAEVPGELQEGVDLVLDGGELPGRSSTVIELRELEEHGRWKVVREGALGIEDVMAALGPSR
jgi:L-threonylcarbamoyladenylate synthase